MKKLLTFILLTTACALALPTNVAAKKPKTAGEPKVVFADKVHDFGSIPEKGGPVSFDFEFVNEGDGNYLILDATAECGCTRPTYPKDPVAPGKKNRVKVTYNPAGRPGPFEKTVTLKTNGQPRKVRLKIRGTVTR